MELFTVALFLIITAFGYLKIADKFNIVDKPNERSSHVTPTIRGGGILFVFALLAYFFKSDFKTPFLIIGVLSIAVISFIDDIKTLSANFRLPFQFIAIALVIYQLGIVPAWSIPLVLIAGVGFINIYNFMDGINGITGMYSLSVLIGIYLVNFETQILPENLILYLLLAVVVFGFFNFRKKARFFAGDIGSISIAIVLFYMLTKLMLELQSPVIVLLVAVYGIDAVLTICYRKMIGEKITLPHRHHIYQKFVDINKTPHLKVSLSYMLLQLSIAVVVFAAFQQSFLVQLGIVLAILFVGCILYYLMFKKFQSKII